MRIVTLCGSLGTTSANRLALDVAIERIMSLGNVTSVADASLVGVPMLNPDLVDEPPAPVAVMRSTIESADGVLLAAPEYAGGLAGGIKNALDWLVGSASIYRRPVAILSAGTTGGGFAIEQLVRTLSWQGAFPVSVLSIRAPLTKMEQGKGFVDADTLAAIGGWADRLVAAISMSTEALLECVGTVVSPFGIDVGRRIKGLER